MVNLLHSGELAIPSYRVLQVATSRISLCVRYRMDGSDSSRSHSMGLLLKYLLSSQLIIDILIYVIIKRMMDDGIMSNYLNMNVEI